jgi:alcohol dehydrogenase class IV
VSGVGRWANPVSLLCGPGASDAVGREVGALGRRALVVCDPGVVELPAMRAVLEQLAGAERFTGVVPNPGRAVVRAAVDAARAAGADVIVGLGGGTAMDVAKSAAAAARAPWLLEWDTAGGLVQPDERGGPPSLPLVQVPTTHATGSELNPIASLTDDDDGAKRLLVHGRLYARVAIVDAALHRTVPPRQTAEGSLETLCRVLVPYLTDAQDRALPDRQAEAIIATVLDGTDAALEDPGDLQARTDLALATVGSVQSLANFGRSRHGHVLWYVGNALGGRGLTKGQALAPLLRVQLIALADGTAPPGLGHPRRLHRLAEHDFLARIDAWGLPRTLPPDTDVEAVTAETIALWGGAPLGGLEAALPGLYRAALG